MVAGLLAGEEGAFGVHAAVVLILVLEGFQQFLVVYRYYYGIIMWSYSNPRHHDNRVHELGGDEH